MTRAGHFRTWAIRLGALLGAIIFVCWATNPSMEAPRATDGDCTTIHVSDNGWHTSLYVPAAAFPRDHPFRKTFAWAEWFHIGWGDEGFFRDGPSIWRGVDAIIPPSPSVVHVIALNRPPMEVFSERSVPVSLSRSGQEQLVDLLTQTLAFDHAGSEILLSDGHYPQVSAFYRASPSYHAFHTCNQWTAGILRKSGVEINAPVSMLSGTVMWQLERSAQTCRPIDPSVE